MPRSFERKSQITEANKVTEIEWSTRFPVEFKICTTRANALEKRPHQLPLGCAKKGQKLDPHLVIVTEPDGLGGVAVPERLNQLRMLCVRRRCHAIASAAFLGV